MNTRVKFSALVLFGLILSTAGPAHAWKYGVNQRQCRQQKRIAQGLNSGSLTGREAARLERREAKLAKQEARMRRSGSGLSPSERARLEHEQNNLSQSIHNQKHDAQQR